jgi:hypothetical protein
MGRNEQNGMWLAYRIGCEIIIGFIVPIFEIQSFIPNKTYHLCKWLIRFGSQSIIL